MGITMTTATTKMEKGPEDISDPNLTLTTTQPQSSGSEVNTLGRDCLTGVEVLLHGIAQHFHNHFPNLPTEVQRIHDVKDYGDFLGCLNLLIQDHVLDDFLRYHTECLEDVRKLFASRYPYLMKPDLIDDNDSHDKVIALRRQNEEGQGRWSSQVGPFSEAFRRRGGSHEKGLEDAGQPGSEGSWKLNYTTYPDANTVSCVPARVVHECLDAFNKFEPISKSEMARMRSPDRVTLEELERAERMYHLLNLIKQKPEEANELIDSIPDLPTDLLKKLRNPKTAEELELRRLMERRIITSDPNVPTGIDLELEYDCSLPTPEDVVMEERPNESQTAVVLHNKRPRGISTVHDTALHPYKGWHIEGPKVQLTRARNFLADGDVDRTVDWAAKFAEITEYCAHLQRGFGGEDWGHDLKEVVGMLRAHWVFENHHYGSPELVVDFPGDAWPRQSRRLPKLPGPEVVLRAERAEQRDLTGPRRLLHTPVANAQDQQYEMPLDVLSGCYLKAYWQDGERLWEKGAAADSGKQPSNLAQHETKHYEECMSEGMAHTVKFLSSEGRFRYSPQDVRVCKDGTKAAERESLEAFARFRGGRRAALQQCLNMFGNSENYKMVTPWTTVRLGGPADPRARSQKPDMGIVFPSMMLRDPPPPSVEKRDPWAYTRALQWFKAEELRWARWTREHSIRESSGRREKLRGKEPVMEMPKNWKGPVPNDAMDQEMRKTYELLRRCQKIQQGLKRAARRAPREFVEGLMAMLEAGLRGRAWSSLGLSFAGHEFTSEKRDVVAGIRPTEAAWLEYVCQPSRNRPVELPESLGQYGEVMLARVADLMQDPSPMSIFRDMQPRTMDEFLKELNLVCRGPVRRYRFTREDVIRLAPKLHALKLLDVYRGSDGELMFGRPDTEFHPEDLVCWPGSEPPTPMPKQDLQLDQEVDAKTVVSLSVEDFKEYPKDMPHKNDVRSLRDYVKNPFQSAKDKKRTRNFFHCLAYRLGRSLIALEALHERERGLLRDPARQQHNRDFLDASIGVWLDDTRRRPNDPAANPRARGSWRETLIYPDVVKIADPELYEQHAGRWAGRRWPDGQRDAMEIVRKKILLEAYENKSMIWPMPLPYGGYVEEYKVEWPSSVGNGKEGEKKEKNKKNKNCATLRREPIWTFGHPSRKPVAHLFWDINNWPVHLQSQERQANIRSRGPRRLQPGEGNTEEQWQYEEEGEGYAIPFWKKAEERKKFIPGSDEFWLGDTPLQRKVIENRIRNRFESKPRSRKRSWHERLSTAIFGEGEDDKSGAGDGDGDDDDGDLILPDPDPEMIPKSRPAKRRRTAGPSREGDGDDDVLISRPTAASEDRASAGPVMHIQAVLPDLPAKDAHGSARTTYPPLNVGLQKAAITYHIPDDLDQEEKEEEDSGVSRVKRPFIEYHMPTVKLSWAADVEDEKNDSESSEESEERSSSHDYSVEESKELDVEEDTNSEREESIGESRKDDDNDEEGDSEEDQGQESSIGEISLEEGSEEEGSNNNEIVAEEGAKDEKENVDSDDDDDSDDYDYEEEKIEILGSEEEDTGKEDEESASTPDSDATESEGQTGDEVEKYVGEDEKTTQNKNSGRHSSKGLEEDEAEEYLWTGRETSSGDDEMSSMEFAEDDSNEESGKTDVEGKQEMDADGVEEEEQGPRRSRRRRGGGWEV